MQRLLEALDRVVPATSEQMENGFAELVERVHLTYLRRTLGIDELNGQLAAEDVATLRRLALYLEADATIDHPADDQSLQDALYVAATIFEFLGDYQRIVFETNMPAAGLPQRLAVGDLADITRAMVLYSLGRHESNSAVIGRRLLDLATHNDLAALPLGEVAVVAGLRVIVALLARDLGRAIERGAELSEVIETMRAEWRGDAFPVDDGLFLAAWLEIAEGATTVAAGLLYGSEEIWRRGRARLTEAASRAVALRHAFAFWAADKLGLIADQMWTRSIFQVLAGKRLPVRYLELLAATGAVELWSSQLSVIEAGLLDTNKHFVINLPTGAGKSLLAELAIAKTLLTESGAWGLYLVPSRALVSQVELDLRQRLPRLGISVRTVIAGLEPAGILDEEVAEVAVPQTLTILTPEKLDVYFRNRPDLFSSCRLMVVDEAHKLGDARRGALVDTLLTRFRLRAPGTRFLLLSAVLSNVLEIATWLDHPDGGIRDSWRPTRQLKGLAVRHDVTAADDTRVVRGQLQVARRERYQGGVVLAHRANDLRVSTTLEITLANVFSGEQRLRNGRRTGSTSTDHAAELAARFARLRGLVLIFLSQKSSAERCARQVASMLPRPDEKSVQRDALVSHLSALLGQRHELLGLVSHGVAYHHAGLPMPARRAIEAALRDGIVQVLCATATLQEGVNTPATTVIVAGTQRRDVEADESVDMSIADFANLAGRAGRAGRDTEGQVILLPARLDRLPAARRDGTRYLFPPDEAFIVQSAFVAIEEELEQATSIDDAAMLSPAAQVALLALQAAGLATEDDLLTFFAESLATYQSRRLPGPMARAAHAYLSRAAEQHGAERLARFAQTALPLTDCEQLLTALQTLIDGGYDISAGLRIEGDIAPARIAPLIESVCSVRRLRPQPLRDISMASVAGVIARWMNGDTYTDLAAQEAFGNDVQKVVRFLGAAANELAWGLGAAYLLLDVLAPDRVHREFGLLPLYVEFGVNQPAAAYLSLLGISERSVANALARAHAEVYGTGEVIAWQSFSDVEAWLRELTRDDILELADVEGFQTRVVLEDLGLRGEEATGTGVGILSVIHLHPSVAANDADLVGRLCSFNLVPGPPDVIEARDRVTRQLWGIVGNPRALRAVAPGSFGQLFGVALRYRSEHPDELEIAVRRVRGS